MTHLLIRADGNSTIGAGHLMRCLALGQAWQEEGETPHFAVATVTPALAERLRAEGMPMTHLANLPGSAQDAAQTLALARQLNAKWVVVDGYHFDADFQWALKQAGLRLLMVDDYGHAGHYYADMVLNQNIYAQPSLYPSHEPDTRLLLGPEYALLRHEFWSWRGWRREVAPVARKVLVTLGGSDPDNVTLKVIQALQKIEMKELEARVVVGPANPHLVALQQAVEQSPGQIQLLTEVLNMPELMAWADIAISAGGSTCWELAFMGLPNLILSLTDNQRWIAEGLNDAGNSVYLGHAADITPTMLYQAIIELAVAPERRAVSTQHGQELIDGYGASRVVRQIEGYGLSLRTAQMDDCSLIWEWGNDPIIRSASFSSEPIPWDQHVTWFTNKLSDPQTLYYIALTADNKPIGQIRYQLEKEEAVVSVSLAPGQRSKGYGYRIIRLASQRVFNDTAVNLIHAYVKQDNAASIRAFTKAGFIKNDRVEIQEYMAFHFVLRKDS